jgi:hypothetical protein
LKLLHLLLLNGSSIFPGVTHNVLYSKSTILFLLFMIPASFVRLTCVPQVVLLPSNKCDVLMVGTFCAQWIMNLLNIYLIIVQWTNLESRSYPQIEFCYIKFDVSMRVDIAALSQQGCVMRSVMFHLYTVIHMFPFVISKDL